MEQLIRNLIYVHAFLGGVGLLTGTLDIIVRKGGNIHVKAGKVFSVAMIGSALISLFVARMPGHENLFLFLIGIFTIYMVLAGNRALTFKPNIKQQANITDKAISGAMLAGSLVMIAIGIYGIIEKAPNNVLYVFFGGVGLFMTINDFKMFRTFKEHKSAWLTIHIGRMVGALIASITAFMVAGLNFHNLLAWLSPTILGVPYIIYWSRKVGKKQVAISKVPHS